MLPRSTATATATATTTATATATTTATATGSNACRSYIWSKQVAATQQSNGTWTYVLKADWVFNNIVKFA